MKLPVIGMTLDYDTAPTYSSYPWYALKENYITAIEKMGGVPLLIPYVTPQMLHEGKEPLRQGHHDRTLLVDRENLPL